MSIMIRGSENASVVGDSVLLERVGFTCKHKIADIWEGEPFKILDKPNADIQMLKVTREDGIGRIRPLYRTCFFHSLVYQGNAMLKGMTLDDYSDGTTDPEDLTAATDEVVLNISYSDNERIEEPEEIVSVYSNTLMRNPGLEVIKSEYRLRLKIKRND